MKGQSQFYGWTNRLIVVHCNAIYVCKLSSSQDLVVGLVLKLYFNAKVIRRLCYNTTISSTSTTPSVTTLEEGIMESSTESNASDKAPLHSLSPHIIISILAQILNGYLGDVLTNLLLFYFN